MLLSVRTKNAIAMVGCMEIFFIIIIIKEHGVSNELIV